MSALVFVSIRKPGDEADAILKALRSRGKLLAVEANRSYELYIPDISVRAGSGEGQVRTWLDDDHPDWESYVRLHRDG